MNRNVYLLIVVLGLFLYSCGGGSASEATSESSEAPKSMIAEEEPEIDPMENKGIGPINSVTLGEIDEAMVAQGEAVYNANCTACHKIDKKFIGPAIAGVIERRTPEWIMNMILNPTEMVQKDPIAKQLLIEANGAPMSDQNISEEDARALLEYSERSKFREQRIMTIRKDVMIPASFASPGQRTENNK